MFLLDKYFSYLLLTAVLVVHTMPRPLERLQRQVVQPTWLSLKENLTPVDGKVHVTKDRLDEVAALRQTIQDAVDNGEYAIESPQPNSHFSFPAQEATSTTPVSIFNNFNIFGTDFSQQSATTSWTNFLNDMQRLFSLLFPPPPPLRLENKNEM